LACLWFSPYAVQIAAGKRVISSARAVTSAVPARLARHGNRALKTFVKRSGAERAESGPGSLTQIERALKMLAGV